MKYTIGELADIIDGDRGNNYPKHDDFFDNGYCLFLDTGNVTQTGFSFETTHFISKEKSESLRKGKISRGDIVYTTRGTVGNVAYYGSTIPYDHIRINSGMVILRPRENVVLAKFLFQILKHEKYRSYIKQYCTGSAQPQLPIRNLSQIKIDIPPLKTQEQVANVLSAYDALIENNQKQIKLLEEAAQRLYKEWFVDLRFPGYENTQIIDGVPEEWKFGQAEDFFNISIGKTPPRAEKQWFVDGANGVPWVSISDMGNTGTFISTASEGLTMDAVKKHNVKVIPTGTILVSFKLTVGRVCITDRDMCTNEAIAHFLIQDDYQRPYVYCYLKNFEYDTLGNTSSISKAVNSKIIKSMPFVMPDDRVLKCFNSQVAPILEEARIKQTCVSQLREARDHLLPKLMNGEIEV